MEWEVKPGVEQLIEVVGQLLVAVVYVINGLSCSRITCSADRHREGNVCVINVRSFAQFQME